MPSVQTTEDAPRRDFAGKITEDTPAHLELHDFSGKIAVRVTVSGRDASKESEKTTYPLFGLGKGKRTEAWFNRAMAGEHPGSARESELVEVSIRHQEGDNAVLVLETDPHGGDRKITPNVELGKLGSAAAVSFVVTFDGESATVEADGFEPVTRKTGLQLKPGFPIALTVGFPNLEGEGVNKPLMGAIVTWEILEG